MVDEQIVGHQPGQQPAVGGYVGDQVGIEVGMVQLEVEQGHHLRLPVEKFGARVERRSRVLVPLEDEGTARAGVAQPGRAREVPRSCAEAEAGVAAGPVEHESGQGGRGGLAVGATDHRPPSSAGQTAIGVSLAQHRQAQGPRRSELGVAGLDLVPQDHQLR